MPDPTHRGSLSAEAMEMCIAVAGWIAGAVEGVAFGAWCAGGNLYVVFSFLLGGLVLWFTLRALIRERNRDA